MSDQAAATDNSETSAAATTATTATAADTGSATTATTATAAAASDQATTTTATAAAGPVDYTDFTVPEGYTLEGEVGDKFKAVAKELGLNQEQAQKLIDIDVQRVQAQTESVHKATLEWQTMAKADKEIGGEALDANVAIAKKALDAFGSPALKELLLNSGLGNHPEFIRVFCKIGKAISDDGFVPGGKNQGGGDARSRYPNSNMNP